MSDDKNSAAATTTAAAAPASDSKGCCPPGSWPSLKSDHVDEGARVDIGRGLQAYVVGSADAGKAVLVVPDIFGIDGGRHHAVCDQLASEGFFVVCPDAFRGDYWRAGLDDMDAVAAWMRCFPYEPVVRKELVDIAVPFIHSKKIERIGLVGFCWGCWANFNLCGAEASAALFKCAVNCHPSIKIEPWLFGRSPEEMTKCVRVPQLLLSAGNDPEFTREGGSIITLLKQTPFGDKCAVVDYPDALHGWVNRGDTSDEKVRRDVKDAIERTIAYLKLHV